MRSIASRVALAALLSLPLGTLAQTTPDKNSATELIAEGVKLYDTGRYEAAVFRYQQALALQPNNVVAKAELAMTLHQLGKYEEAVSQCREALALPGKSGPNLYATYANSLDALQRSEEAEQVYKQGLEHYPNYFLLLYNLGVTQHSLHKTQEAQRSFQQAVQANPGHASSNLSWGLSMLDQGNRIPAILALSQFLLLEPNSKRSAENLARLHTLMQQGIEQKEGGATVLSISTEQVEAAKKPKKGSKQGADNFASKEMMLTLLGVVNELPPELASNPVEVYNFRFDLFCQQLLPSKGATGLAWTHYAPFFSEMQKKGHTKAFSYVIHMQDSEQAYARDWLKEHSAEVDALYAWANAYKWPK
ncbi:glycosyltransferase family 41 protein [Hymenobacter sp. YC55]|uniref:tetratricopeptide repeat protein n=1 Tax=Hymenobacter sp. YC55 TaxID=3034019 RepID=UPI0023F7D343|nr:glycosyltransferase family 41 protein [Hymenobacter sp. YC55]MDF7815912.1 tetratricopeptide repeat protein [Hymenobacter sp. YC55]